MAEHIPATDAELRWAYRMSRFQAQGITYEQAVATPALRAALELGATIRRRRRAHAIPPNTGAGIERSQPDYRSTTH